jgi:hypothetical protein
MATSVAAACRAGTCLDVLDETPHVAIRLQPQLLKNHWPHLQHQPAAAAAPASQVQPHPKSQASLQFAAACVRLPVDRNGASKALQNKHGSGLSSCP